MNAGRELDAQIAKEIFGLDPVWSGKNKKTLSDGDPNWTWIRFEGSELLNSIPHYSTDLTQAIEILNKFVIYKMGTTTVGNMADVMYFCEIFNGKEFVVATGTSISHAICLAALLTKEKK